MPYFSPGFREIIRLVQRARWRLRGWLAHRRLASAETQLGLLGWEQADFDTETQRQVDAIHHVEREQGELTNRAAALAREIEAIAVERAAVPAAFDKQRTALEAERASVREPLAEIERILRVVHARPADVARSIAELQRELGETDVLYTKLLGTEPQTPQVRDEVLRLRERLIAIPNEVADIKAMRHRAASDIAEREQQQKQIEQRTAELDRQLRELKADADQRDATSAARIKTLENERARAGTAAHRLDRAKTDPYREIGRVLADNDIAPMNQPHALEWVRTLRATITDTEAAVAESLQRTAAEDAPLLRASLAVWIVIGLAVIFVVGALF